MTHRRILVCLVRINLLILPIFVAATVWADSLPLPSGVDWTRSAPAATAPGAPPAYPRTNLSASTTTTTTIYLPFIIKNHTINITPLWRFGVAKVRQSPSSYGFVGLVNLRIGWYVDYTANGSALPSLGMDYVPIVRVKQLKLKNGIPTADPCYACPYVPSYTYTVSPGLNQLPALVASRPGLLWVVGNEIERRDWYVLGGSDQGQDEIVPELYAQAYHEVYTAIKNADLTAMVAIGSMIEWTPLRQQYLDRVWNEYSSRYGQTMPVDVWNLHIFILQEVSGDWGAGIPAGLSNTTGALYTPLQNKDFSIAAQQIVDFRTWMKNHGQQNKPLIITEYGVLFSDWVLPGQGQFTPEQVRDSFMYPSFNYFLNQTSASLGYPADGNRLVQRWIWYSLDDDSIFSCSTYNSPSGRCQNFNGNLFSSGYEGVPAGMTTLGVYWQQYIAPLPADSGSHY